MQITHRCNSQGRDDYPKNVKPKNVNVWMHGSGLIATHDYSCPICRDNPAMFDLNTGIMNTCGRCHEKGYRIKKERWWNRLFKI